MKYFTLTAILTYLNIFTLTLFFNRKTRVRKEPSGGKEVMEYLYCLQAKALTNENNTTLVVRRKPERLQNYEQ